MTIIWILKEEKICFFWVLIIPAYFQITKEFRNDQYLKREEDGISIWCIYQLINKNSSQWKLTLAGVHYFKIHGSQSVVPWPRTSSSSVTRELVRNLSSWAPHQTYWSKNSWGEVWAILYELELTCPKCSETQNFELTCSLWAVVTQLLKYFYSQEHSLK